MKVGLRRRWWVIAITAVITALVLPAANSVTADPTYTGVGALMVAASAESPVGSDSYISANMASYQSILSGSAFIDGLAELTGRDADELGAALSFSAASETRVLTVYARGDSASAARELLDEVVPAVQEYLVGAETSDGLGRVEVIPFGVSRVEAPVSVSPGVLAVLGLVVGTLLGIALSAVLSGLWRRVELEEDVVGALPGVPVIALNRDEIMSDGPIEFEALALLLERSTERAGAQTVVVVGLGSEHVADALRARSLVSVGPGDEMTSAVVAMPSADSVIQLLADEPHAIVVISAQRGATVIRDLERVRSALDLVGANLVGAVLVV